MKKKINKPTRKQQTTKYWNQKKKLSTILDNATLARWKILSEAQKIGKSVWGAKFTIVRLANDMDMPYSTVQRCISLNKANKKTWAHIKAKRLSVFRAAMILQTKDNTFQDEIVDLVIKENLSTFQIKTLQIKQLQDIKLERQRLACENGFSRKESAYRSLTTWITKGKMLLLMDKSHLPSDKIDDIQAQLKSLNAMITAYIK
tara:strand:- start:519 stop:1127 length:609 start_codon:yes stop_codon:yes gene_type:complete